MIDRVEATFDIKPDRWVGDTAYGSGPMLGWIVNEKQIAPTYWCGINRRAKTEPYLATTSDGTRRLTNIAVPKAMRCVANGAHSRPRAAMSPRTARSNIELAHSTVRLARSRRVAAPTHRFARLRAASMRRRGMGLAPLPRPMHTSNPIMIARRWKCCLLI